jgi:uncharacterized protein YecE (DUF72 family)
MKICVGTSGYSYKEWKGKFYPGKISPGEMLRYYSERLSTVEINNTFYHMPTESVLLSWAEQVPDNFLFALKAPQIITHLKRLRNVESETDYLFSTLSVLDRKLGPVLFQFPASFHADISALGNFLNLVPANIPCAFEFRSASWLTAETLGLLRGKRCSLCIADTDENHANGIVSTAQWGYLRLRRSDYTDSDLSNWMDNILSQKWGKAFVFFKHEGDARGPEFALLFNDLALKVQKKKLKKERGHTSKIG